MSIVPLFDSRYRDHTPDCDLAAGEQRTLSGCRIQDVQGGERRVVHVGSVCTCSVIAHCTLHAICTCTMSHAITV